MRHKHHIIPKHMGGSDDPSNLIELTGETVDPRAWKQEKNKDRKEIKSNSEEKE